MAIETRAVFAEARIAADGVLEIRLDKQTVDGDKIIWREPHRVAIEPGQDVDAVMAGVIASLGRGVQLQSGDVVQFPVADQSAARVKAIAAIEHTPERIAEFVATKARAAAAGAVVSLPSAMRQIPR